ncbi:MAG: UDP-N-acetylmuramoyl-L-alanyl-D-glutamate--2,6-diaminopimelate ligase [Pseudomonadota bacterium]
MKSITFAELLQDIRDNALSIQTDSRAVQAGHVFVAVSGVAVDGATFIPKAVAAGARYIVCQEKALVEGGALDSAARADLLAHERVVSGDVLFVYHGAPRAVLGTLAQARYGTDALPFSLVGITGTNGKTTITYLLEHLFKSAGKRTGVLGTVSYRWPNHEHEAPMTTPDCLELHGMLAEMAKADVDVAFMEVSSHALDQDRVGGLSFAGAVLTNLTQDHLDYHGDMENYFQAKARLFTTLPSLQKTAAINADDAWGRKLLGMLVDMGLNPVAFGLGGEHVEGTRVLHGEMLRCSTAGVHLRMTFEDPTGEIKTWEIDSPLVGAHNASNLLAVQAIGLGLGLTPQDFACFEDFAGVSGRLERVMNDKGLDIFVDYAHTPDALINVLKALRAVGFKRIIAVFGCGGNRDRTKRPLMGQAVAEFADIAVLTSDNPRKEEPLAIMDDVMPGLVNAKEVFADPDRRTAIAKAIAMMQEGDAVLIAGKGHESYQIIGDVKHHYSDQETVVDILS